MAKPPGSARPVIITSERFLADAVAWAEQHNDDAAPLIEV